QDGGDKGIMKAISACVKYAALKALCLPTGDDAEADSEPDHREPAANGRRTADAPTRESPSPSSPPWQDTPWPEDESSADSERSSADRTRVSDRAAPKRPAPARERNRPRPEDCISEGKVKRLHAIMQTKARDYEWEFDALRAHVKWYVLDRYG